MGCRWVQLRRLCANNRPRCLRDAAQPQPFVCRVLPGVDLFLFSRAIGRVRNPLVQRDSLRDNARCHSWLPCLLFLSLTDYVAPVTKMSQDSEILTQSAYGMMQRLDLRPKGRRFKNVEVAGLALPVQPPQHS